MRSDNLLILGFGGHARSVGDIALSFGYKKLLFVDVNAHDNEHFIGHKVVREIPERCITDQWDIFPGSGDNGIREQQMQFAKKVGLYIPSLIAPSANISHGAKILEGCLIGHHAHVGPLVTIGRGSIINTGSIVDHEATVGNYCHVSINATMAGRSCLGDRSFLGASATIIDTIKVTSECIIGAGACVISDLRIPGTYIGIPARLI